MDENRERATAQRFTVHVRHLRPVRRLSVSSDERRERMCGRERLCLGTWGRAVERGRRDDGREFLEDLGMMLPQIPPDIPIAN